MDPSRNDRDLDRHLWIERQREHQREADRRMRDESWLKHVLRTSPATRRAMELYYRRQRERGEPIPRVIRKGDE